jgi:hypothetical protein
MLQVGVDDTQKIGVSLCPSMNHRARQSTFDLSHEHSYARVICSARTAYIGCAVGAAVIHDYEFAIHWRISNCGAQAV